MSATARFTDEIKGRHVLIGFILFFGVIFLANGIFLYYALSTFGGGDKASPYRSGLRYNETIAEAARAAELGWQGELAYDAKTGRLALTLHDKKSEPVAGLHFSATVGRPVTDREDVSATFRETKGGSYVAELNLAPGQWIVELQSNELSRQGDPVYRLKRRVFVPDAP